MDRVLNFSAGPSTIPLGVLKQAQEELLNYAGHGFSIMEISHRTKIFEEVLHSAMDRVRDLYGFSDDFTILFLQGGASLQFAQVPMNLYAGGVAEYANTGNWTSKAIKEAGVLGINYRVVASSEESKFDRIPEVKFSDDADYGYICSNNTIYGTAFHGLPNTKGHVLVADQSSMFLSEPVDVTDFGLIHAGVQKNVGPAGVQIVIVRDDLIPDDLPGVPTMLRFKTQADAGSLYNTPNCWGIYICGKVFKWVAGQGGLAGMRARNEEKATKATKATPRSTGEPRRPARPRSPSRAAGRRRVANSAK